MRQALLTRIALGTLALSFALAPAPTAQPVQSPLPQLGESARPTPYSPDPEHPWNRLHAALFRQRLRTSALPCLLEGSCGTLALERMFATVASVWFEEGALWPSQNPYAPPRLCLSCLFGEGVRYFYRGKATLRVRSPLVSHHPNYRPQK